MEENGKSYRIIAAVVFITVGLVSGFVWGIMITRVDRTGMEAKIEAVREHYETKLALIAECPEEKPCSDYKQGLMEGCKACGND